MTPEQRLRRLVYWFLFAVFVAICLSLAADLSAQSDDDPPSEEEYEVYVYIYQQGGCAALVPYGYWWFFWGCNELGGSSRVESVTLTLTEDVALLELRYTDGEVRHRSGPVKRRKAR